ncbi:MAG: DUF1987 domain-containing protein [Bacteroidetes bacterium]|nr:DUF1987 domain-containing protein [Bacteroidota bacterium]
MNTVICSQIKMANLYIEKTKKTPEITFLKNGDLNFIGCCIPEDANAFFHPLMLWLEDFTNNPSDSVNLLIDLEYINTSSTTHILKFLKRTIEIGIEKSMIKIVWKYDPEDEDAYEQGEMLQKILKHPILLVSNQIKG